jgi:hypothetical protein
VSTVGGVSAQTLGALPTKRVGHDHPVPGGHALDPCTDFLDEPGPLVPQDQRKPAACGVLLHTDVRVTDAGGNHPDQDLIGSRLSELHLLKSQVPRGLLQHRRLDLHADPFVTTRNRPPVQIPSAARPAACARDAVSAPYPDCRTATAGGGKHAQAVPLDTACLSAVSGGDPGCFTSA